MDHHLQEVWLHGEISNFNHHSRGHMYMTIKDEHSKIQAVMFAGNNRHLKFYPENGLKVLIKGNVSIYEPAGQYQLYIKQMEPDGIGSLFLAFEQLKEKLKQKGYFSLERKRPIPKFPQRIGIVTSPTGAAVRDIITTIKRRYPLVELVIFPAEVQGNRGAQSIAKAIETANEVGGIDTLIVGRGGGSIEELWCFNEEIVATAIYHSDIPVISAVGHETDTTISDFVADLRAPTPTGAAELAVPSRDDLQTYISQLQQRLNREMDQLLNREKRYLESLVHSYAFRYPQELLKQKEQQLDQQLEALDRILESKVNHSENDLEALQKRLILQHPEEKLIEGRKKLSQLVSQKDRLMRQLMENKQRDLLNVLDKLDLVNPLGIMKRGFALLYDAEGKLIKSVCDVKKDDEMHVTLSDGTVDAKVLHVKENANG